MKFKQQHRDDISEALQKHHIGLPATAKVMGLLDKLMENPESIEAKVDEMMKHSFPQKDSKEPAKSK